MTALDVIHDLDAWVTKAIGSDEVIDALDLDADLDLLAREIRTARSLLAGHVHMLVDRDADPDERTTTKGMFELRGGGPASVKYDNPRVLSVIAARLADDCSYNRDTGERLPPGEAAQLVCEHMAALTGALTPSFSAWRKTPAKKLGLDLSAFELGREGHTARTIQWSHADHELERVRRDAAEDRAEWTAEQAGSEPF